MRKLTYEGKVVNGAIQLPAGVPLRENSRVLVVIADTEPLARLETPRLAHPGQAKAFVLEMEAAPDASV